MAKGLKTNGVAELEAVKKRTGRQRVLGKISREDSDYIQERLNEVIAYIVKMDEKGEDEREW